MTVEEAIVVLHRAVRVTGVTEPGMTDRDLVTIARRNADRVPDDVEAAARFLEARGYITGDSRLQQREELADLLTSVGLVHHDGWDHHDQNGERS